MKPKTRDNLIYLAVGLGITALLVAQDFYAESHDGRVIVRLSTFAFRTVTTTLLVAYFAAREIRRVNGSIADVVLCTLLSGLLQLAISFGFRDAVGQLSSLPYVGLAALEAFLIVKLTARAVLYVRGKGR